MVPKRKRIGVVNCVHTIAWRITGQTCKELYTNEKSINQLERKQPEKGNIEVIQVIHNLKKSLLQASLLKDSNSYQVSPSNIVNSNN